MELRQLRYFAAVADTLNFSRAAEGLFISQSALSKQISDMEQELGVLLFQRSKHSVELTEAGRLMLDEAHTILLRMGKLPSLLQSRSPVDDQPVFIGIDEKCDQDQLVQLVLAEAVYQQRLRAPGLRALFFRRSLSSLQQAMLGGEIELGLFLSTEPTIDKAFEHCLLGLDEMVLVLRSDEDLPQDLDTVKRLLAGPKGLIMTRRELPELSHIVHILDDIGCTPNIRYTEDRVSALLNVKSGDGVMILPRSAVQQAHDPHLKALPLHSDFAKLHLLAAWRRGAPPLVKQIVFDVKNSMQVLQPKPY